MSALRWAAGALFALGLVVGTALDAPRTLAPLAVGGYRVIEADFHVHAFFGDGWLAPWDLVLEAQRRNLHAFAITNHNQVFAARLGRWFSRRVGGPVVLVGEEITAPRYHIAAIGLTTTVAWRQSAAAAVEAVHRQGGVAIAAHPAASYWNGFDDTALRTLDGAEAAHPAAFAPRRAAEMREFWRHAATRGAHLTAIGSSDYHALSGLGLCRTYVFVRDVSEAGILTALREGHTVVFDPQGQAFGEAALVEPLRQALRARAGFADARPMPSLDVLGRACGLIGLLALVLLG
jgi:hypothetical protein